ncbi:uncharacterized protein LOC143857211 isoform X2 [Tasmannia lanceolata]|uniref:uncharacterized protein LOC143857211 isoform X2 n=1 Tax=Tasmannia lanceolata TaxID=3420 RepID=UPI004063430E
MSVMTITSFILQVDELHKMLDHEAKVNKLLHQTMHGSIPPIPNFLPPKMKELLAELAMVEGEIARLEREISHLQSSLNHEQKGLTEASKLKQWQVGSLSNIASPDHSSAPPQPKGKHERRPSEAKAMFFINQAIKGNYSTNDFTRNENIRNSISIVDQKESQKEAGLRKSGKIEKHSTYKLPPKHPKSKPVERDSDLAFKFTLSSSPYSSPLENSQKWPPNKLSESIMKCLMCIFLRLIRTTKALELEKSGVVARSIHSSSGSRSHRTESSLNSKANQREFGQQDPYGIFDIEDSLPRDIGPYKNFVRCTSSSLDMKGISSATTLLTKLRGLMDNLCNVDLRFLSYQQKLAFWINMYNACIMHGFLQYGLPSSPHKLLALTNKAVLNIGGNKLNALAIEHFILRQSSKLKEVYWKGEKDIKEDVVRSFYGLDRPEPNVTFSLCCGNRSSPAVRIYTADGVSAELEKSKLEYLQASIVVTSTKRLMIPKLLIWNMLDVASDMESFVEWVCNQLPTSGSLRKSMMECLRDQNNGKTEDIVKIMPYEFEFQYLLAM